jgi:hypothetical protein
MKMMSKHVFKLRMNTTYTSSENDINSLDVEMLEDNEWKTLDLNTRTPGFLVYVYSIFTCQHMFLRTNGTERNLVYASSNGNILVEAGEEWLLEKIYVSFNVKLATGKPDDDDVSYIISRMQQCPVSKNLPQNLETHTRVEFIHD